MKMKELAIECVGRFDRSTYGEWIAGVSEACSFNLAQQLLIRNEETKLVTVNFDPQVWFHLMILSCAVSRLVRVAFISVTSTWNSGANTFVPIEDISETQSVVKIDSYFSQYYQFMGQWVGVRGATMTVWHVQFFTAETRYSRRWDGRLRPGALDETYALSLIWAYSLHYMKTWRHPQNWKYITYRIAVRGGPSHGTANMHIKFGEMWTSRLDVSEWRQTDIQTRACSALFCKLITKTDHQFNT